MGWRPVVVTIAALAASAVPSAMIAGGPVAAGTGDVPTEGRVPATNAPLPTAQTPQSSSSAPVPEKEVDLAPVIHCTWISPDMDPLTDGHEYAVDGFADDLPSMPAPTPCASSPENGVPMSAAAGQPIASVKPNGADLPSVRRVELWTTLSHAVGPASISGVSFAVSAPDGRQIATSNSELVTDAGALDQSLTAARLSGQVDGLSEQGFRGLAADNWLVLGKVTVAISYLDGCGPFTVDVTARAGELTTTASTTFEVICFHELVADFDSVDWRDLVPGATSIVTGDLDTSTPRFPTISNHGNVAMSLATTFAPLCLEGGGSGTCIGDFGLEVSVVDRSMARAGPAEAGVELVDPNVVLCPGDVARTDFVVRAPQSMRAGDYAGSLRLVGIGGDGESCGQATDATQPVPTTIAPPAQPTTTVAPTIAPTTAPHTGATAAPTTAAGGGRTTTTPATSTPATSATSTPASSSSSSSSISSSSSTTTTTTTTTSAASGQ